MCGIGGFCNFHHDSTRQPELYYDTLSHIHQILSHRGPDAHGTWLAPHVGFSHARLSIIDLKGGQQPMFRIVNGHPYSIIYNGELYNTHELRQELISCGHSFETNSDTEVILVCYLEYGADFVTRLNGIFAIANWER